MPPFPTDAPATARAQAPTAETGAAAAVLVEVGLEVGSRAPAEAALVKEGAVEREKALHVRRKSRDAPARSAREIRRGSGPRCSSS
jgi:hypothetical protein